MKKEQFDVMLSKASKSVQALNRDIAKECPSEKGLYLEDSRRRSINSSVNPPKKRIRQSSKPLLNKLETEWLAKLEIRYGPNEVKPQSKKYKLANGCWYCPDFTVNEKHIGGFTVETCYEVKGKRSWDDAMVKLKVAAHQWPEVKWILAWKENGEWKEQWVLA